MTLSKWALRQRTPHYHFHPESPVIDRLIRRMKRLVTRPGFKWQKMTEPRLRLVMFTPDCRDPERSCRDFLGRHVLSQRDALYLHLLLDREFKLCHDRASESPVETHTPSR